MQCNAMRPGEQGEDTRSGRLSLVSAAWWEHGMIAKFSVWLRQLIEALDFRSDKPGF